MGAGMSSKMWDGLVEHAQTCVLNGKAYGFWDPKSSQRQLAVFNNVYQLIGLVQKGIFTSSQMLSPTDMVRIANRYP